MGEMENEILEESAREETIKDANVDKITMMREGRAGEARRCIKSSHVMA